MAFKVITAAASEPITRQEAKLHCRVIADLTDVATHPEDAAFDSWIIAARGFSEHYTGRAFGAQTLEMALNGFGGSNASFDLDMPPVASITSIKYTDVAGVEQTVAATAYALSTYGDSRRVAPTYGNYWPPTQDIPDAVRIRYVTGYAAAFPKAARTALLLLVGHMYENRQAVSALKIEEIPLGARSLLDTIKIWSK